MPNWCLNNLTLKHKDTAKLNGAIAAFERGRFFEHFVPLPNDEWDYDFCVKYWGTKWDVGGENNVVTPLGENTYGFNFDSAWSPPIEIYRQMCAEGFELEASYYEPGMAFVGKIVGNENEFDDEYYEFGNETSDTVRDLIGAELDDEWAISEQMAEWEYDQEKLDMEEYCLPPHTD